MNEDAWLALGAENAALLEEMYERYEKMPGSVPASFREMFKKLEVPVAVQEVISDDIRIHNVRQAYRTFGHLMADINPIALTPPLEPEALRFRSGDLKEIIDDLRATYCGKIGVEYMHLQDSALESFLQERIEKTKLQSNLTIEEKQQILQQLNKSELFESFLHTKYIGQKRFSLEGGESLIPMLGELIESGVEAIVLGMAHRGRLNVLSNILNKSYAEVFGEFEDNPLPGSFEGSGDVKYHKGYSSQVTTTRGKRVKIDLMPNPSHLESVDGVVEGYARAEQLLYDDLETREKVLPILIHGDAAIAGQGVVYEVLQFCRLAGYSTGGTIHIVVNNQIGFTTVPSDTRSTPYCTDIAKAFGAPVFHVNGEDPESCVIATRLALEIRQKFHCDVFIDLNCYRKYGHNETDEPAYTQPLEYQLIRKKKPIRELYRDQLIAQGVLEKYMAEKLETEFKKALQMAQRETKASLQAAFEKSAPIAEVDLFQPFETGVDTLPAALAFCTIPKGFTIHPKLANLLEDRLSMAQGKKPVDWGMAELLAYASLLWEGVHVRLSGQDCCRGTFSHRHALWMDQVVERGYFPLQHLREKQGRFDVYNSPLSEYGVMGFEFGYSLGCPDALVIWEAQFGDFCNSGQVIIDQYIAAAEQKWNKRSRLVFFLPHGYEGQGPEHSSARLERFLTLCGHDNMQVVYPTTPAQLFHLLRRQVLRPIQKPLIVFTPKGLLRHPQCVNAIQELSKGRFHEILDDPAGGKPSKLIFCTGRIYYDLIAERERARARDVTIIRIEQLYPLHMEELKRLITKYSGFKECFWVQEEPSNMGAWDFVRPLLLHLLQNKELKYVGRARSAAPATGSYTLHKKEHADMMHILFGSYETTTVPHELKI